MTQRKRKQALLPRKFQFLVDGHDDYVATLQVDGKYGILWDGRYEPVTYMRSMVAEFVADGRWKIINIIEA